MKNKGYAIFFFFLGGGGDKVHQGKCGSGVEVNMLATNLTIFKQENTLLQGFSFNELKIEKEQTSLSQ